MPKQIDFTEHEGGTYELPFDCPECGTPMEEELERGDLKVSICPNCGHREQGIRATQSLNDPSADQTSPYSFLGIGGDSLKSLLKLAVVFLFAACSPTLEKEVPDAETPQMHELSDSVHEQEKPDQLFAVYRVPGQAPSVSRIGVGTAKPGGEDRPADTLTTGRIQIAKGGHH